MEPSICPAKLSAVFIVLDDCRQQNEACSLDSLHWGSGPINPGFGNILITFVYKDFSVRAPVWHLVSETLQVFEILKQDNVNVRLDVFTVSSVICAWRDLEKTGPLVLPFSHLMLILGISLNILE